jgi:hypothetical protein
MGQVLFDLLNERNLKLYPAADLRQQALSTVGIETARGTRIGKDKTSKKIDAIVALAMACVSAIDYGQTTGLFVGVDLATKHDSARSWRSSGLKKAQLSVSVIASGSRRRSSRSIWKERVEWYLRELHSKGEYANRPAQPTKVIMRRPNEVFGWRGPRF